jgi:predicted nuclease of predicted toxin-antitoxin system
VRVLVDQCLPRHLAAELPGHEATTVRAQRWLGLRNGVLLRAAVHAGFEVFITNDSSLEFQQNVKRIGIAVIAITGVRNRIEDLRPLIPRILEHLKTIEPGTVVTIAG